MSDTSPRLPGILILYQRHIDCLSMVVCLTHRPVDSSVRLRLEGDPMERFEMTTLKLWNTKWSIDNDVTVDLKRDITNSLTCTALVSLMNWDWIGNCEYIERYIKYRFRQRHYKALHAFFWLDWGKKQKTKRFFLKWRRRAKIQNGGDSRGTKRWPKIEFSSALVAPHSGWQPSDELRVKHERCPFNTWPARTGQLLCRTSEPRRRNVQTRSPQSIRSLNLNQLPINMQLRQQPPSRDAEHAESIMQGAGLQPSSVYVS